MKKQEFVEKIIDALELEHGELTDENSMLIDIVNSFGVLQIIALCDEYFSKELDGDKLRSVTTVKSLMELIGLENFKD